MNNVRERGRDTDNMGGGVLSSLLFAAEFIWAVQGIALFLAHNPSICSVKVVGMCSCRREGTRC